jgi:S-adenosylmethionine decarboxylase proenzyme
MEAAAEAAKTKVVESLFHPFHPQGVTGIVVIEESHLSIHTWPEFEYAAVDFYTCGKGEPEEAHKVLLKGLDAIRYEILSVDRGIMVGNNQMQLREHTKHSILATEQSSQPDLILPLSY